MTVDPAAGSPLLLFSGAPRRAGPGTAPGRRLGADPRFAAEATTALSAGAGCAVLDHEALLAGDTEGALARVPRGAGPVWYRGWALPPERYAALAGALAAHGGRLLTSPAAYRTAHELPGWYDTFRALTPRSIRLPYAVGRAPEPAAPAVESFDAVGTARVWWLDGEPVLTGPHPDTPGLRPVPDLASVAPAVRALGARFVTTDLARRADGVWRVVEVGDGQVSGLPAGLDHRPLFEALVTAGAGYPLALTAGRVALRALLPTTAARVADGESAGFDWIDGAPAETTSGGAGIAVRAAAAGHYRPGWGVFVLTDAVAGTALGSIGFHGPPDDEGFVEIGYDLSPSARGAGWATEAVRLLAGWAAAHPEVRTVCALTEPENLPSQRVLERAGFRFVGEREGLRAYEAAAVAPNPAGAEDEEPLNAGSHPRS
ncbi:N-acetyltransferase [Streptomyces sp. TM32]|uniref:GNAT family N-acetyltransferase n=1 Tax=Streptomyces sp. TM32 TaxID=1652669 RepID=UPI0010132A6B|nr:GNAT family N-acetyltransferase [Streptomyces sp. TM32]RXS88163.1 N-acetyltransferase [Streptomyces sp. TM32]